MIIELFGAPGAGKTTFAYALSERLRRHGYSVQLLLSYRPDEQSGLQRSGPSGSQSLAVLKRIVRPMLELTRLRASPHELDLGLKLTSILKQRNVLATWRVLQYIARLERSWASASSSGKIVLFDQAFVQAIYSLVLYRRRADEELMTIALAAIPKSDLLVRLNAREAILEARLRERHRRQGPLERLFEPGVKTNLTFARVVDQLHDLLRRSGRPIIEVSCIDHNSLQAGVAAVEEHVVARLARPEEHDFMIPRMGEMEYTDCVAKEDQR